MPKLNVQGVGEFDVPEGKRLIKALVEDAGIKAGEASTSYLETWLESHTIEAA